MKIAAYCFECDNEFKVTYSGADPIKFCPICGEELTVDDEDELEEE